MSLDESKVSTDSTKESEYEDILGSGAVCRKILRKIDEITENPEYGDEVTIRYTGYLKGESKPLFEDKEETFRIGDGETLPGLELVARMMKVGERDELICDERFGYGEIGYDPLVPPSSDLRFEVDLISINEKKKLPTDMTAEELLREASKKKERGNNWYKMKNYANAARVYKSVLKMMESWTPNELDNECKTLLVSIGNNVANVQSKLKQYKEARQSCKEVLELDNSNIKAMYRLAHVLYLQDDLNESLKTVRKALEIENSNRSLRNLLAQVLERKKEILEKEKRLYGYSSEAPSAPPKPSKPLVLQQRKFYHDWRVMSLSALILLISFTAYKLINRPKVQT